MKEIVLPPHLYDRIKASAGEHGGIGRGALFDGGFDGAGDTPDYGMHGAPLCAHGHAWGTCTRFKRESTRPNNDWMAEPELNKYLSWTENDNALEYITADAMPRIPFARWCHLLNVKRGVEAPSETPAVQEREAVPA